MSLKQPLSLVATRVSCLLTRIKLDVQGGVAFHWPYDMGPPFGSFAGKTG